MYFELLQIWLKAKYIFNLLFNFFSSSLRLALEACSGINKENVLCFTLYELIIKILSEFLSHS